jgi:hypothetical protein
MDVSDNSHIPAHARQHAEHAKAMEKSSNQRRWLGDGGYEENE